MIKKQVDTGMFIRSIGAVSTSSGAKNKVTALKELAEEYPYADGWEVIETHYISPRTQAETDAGLYTFAVFMGKYEYVAK
jgi:hypothetical protein